MESSFGRRSQRKLYSSFEKRKKLKCFKTNPDPRSNPRMDSLEAFRDFIDQLKAKGMDFEPRTK